VPLQAPGRLWRLFFRCCATFKNLALVEFVPSLSLQPKNLQSKSVSAAYYIMPHLGFGVVLMKFECVLEKLKTLFSLLHKVYGLLPLLAGGHKRRTKPGPSLHC